MASDPTVAYGQRLLINVVDERADAGYSWPYMYIPKTIDPKDGFTEVSYASLRDAADRVAHFLDETLGKAANFDTFAWMGPPNDPRYLLLILASMKTARKVFFPSPRNSIEAHLALLEATQCTAFMEPEASPIPIVHSILGQRPMRLVTMPALGEFLNAAPPRPYRFQKSFDQARFDPCLILHTSGSTGIPKPIVIKHGWFSVPDSLHNLASLGSDEAGALAFAGRKVFVPFPNFHSAAVAVKLSCAVWFETAMIELPNAPLTATLADQCHIHSGADASMLPSSIVRDLTRDPAYLENLKRLQFVAFGGSPLAEDVGEIVSQNTRVLNTFGTTELCMVPFEKTDPEDWKYLKFGTNTGVDFRFVSDDQYEMVMVRKPHLDLYQGNFVTEPDIQEWPTKDLWVKHPRKPNLWRYRGRLDDIIVFESGEKFNPTTMQQTIESHSGVAGALVAGAGRFQSCLILEPRRHLHTATERSAFIEEVWPLVQKANTEAVAHGRVSKGMILVGSPEKPFMRADKGSIKKKMSLALYEDEINKLYLAFEHGTAQGLPPLDLSSFSAARNSLRSIILQLTQLDELKDDEEFFSVGMDSLQASDLARGLNAASRGSVKLEPRNIYADSSLNALAAKISGFSPPSSTDTGVAKSREEAMEAMYNTLTEDLPINGRPSIPSPTKHVVLLTGSTGSIGSYLLDLMIADSDVEEIVCLNRSADARKKQLAALKSRGLTQDLSKATFIQVPDFSKPYLSLDEPTYCSLLAKVTHVLHNAWPVDFNRGLMSFESHVRGVRRFVDFCAASTRGAALSFVSTVATAAQWRGNTPADRVPERVFRDWSVSHGGYGSGKQVAELVLDAAARRSGVATTVLRLGQVGGAVAHGGAGLWPRAEWLPSLLASSVHLRRIPDALAGVPVDWMPIDLLARAMLEVALGPAAREVTGAGARVRNFINPHAVDWKELVPAVIDALPADKRPQIVPLQQWIDALHASEEQNNLDANPALKLMPFFESLTGGAAGASLSVEECTRDSKALREMEPVNTVWMGMWMRQWQFA